MKNPRNPDSFVECLAALPRKGLRFFSAQILFLWLPKIGVLRNRGLEALWVKGLKWRGPHSLGKLIEWKPIFKHATLHAIPLVPTRWGNSLNGNNNYKIKAMISKLKVPTRWGNSLNGNFINTGIKDTIYYWSPLAGETH